MEIRDSNGALLEQGAAVINRTGLGWLYTATTANGSLAGTVVKATATDIPEHEGMLEVIL